MVVNISALKEKATRARMGVSLSGVLSRGRTKADQFMGREICRFFEEGRAAFLKGDFETVAEMFSIIKD